MFDASPRIREKLRPYYLRLYFKLRAGGRPTEFTDSWRFPWFPLDSNSLASHLPGESPAPAFLFFPMTNWHTRIQRSQQFARALSGMGHTCFYFNPYLGRQFSSLFLFDRAARFGLLGSRLAEMHVRVHDEPLFHDRLLRSSENQRIVSALLALGGVCENLVQVVSLPTWLDASLALRERFGWPIIYDCHDLLSGFRGVGRDVQEMERSTLDAADYVVFSSQHLLDVHTDHNPELAAKSDVLRNAADVEHFGRSADAPLRWKSAGGRIGYFGALDDWFDVELVWECAKRRPDLVFQLIGRIEDRRVSRLAQLPNVELCGEIPYEHLPNFMSGFDAAIIPFRRTPLTIATNPIKLYEYFSGGIPVVSTRLPEVENFGDLVYTAGNAKEFSDCLQEALNERCPEKRARRIGVASRETWRSRGADLVRISSALVSHEPQAMAHARTTAL